jgi:3-oxoacid CoA-transferase subunit A
MAILFSGDFHANSRDELSSITKEALVEQFGTRVYNTINYHVILGDGGFLWPKNKRIDALIYKLLAYRPFPVLCVIGNHEPILGRTDIPEVDIGLGETVYQIHPLVSYLKRGKIYRIDGFKFLVLGGALSIDLVYRVPGLSWWANEYWSEQEKEDIFALLEKENSFDFVLSHTGPDRINIAAFSDILSNSEKYGDQVALLNDQIDDRITCKQWWCGHWHMDRYCYDNARGRGYHYLCRTVKILTGEHDFYSILPR